MDMGLWHSAAADMMVDFIKTYLRADEVTVNGSLLDPRSVDIYSDVDINTVLPDNTPVDIKSFINKLPGVFCGVFGYEIHYNVDSDVLRICFENGWRFDIAFVYSRRNGPPESEHTYENKIENLVNAFWFISSMSLIKLGRGDYLIAAHLALELCQNVIVLQMLVRDEQKKTAVHRFGDMEDVPVLRSITKNIIRDEYPKDIKNTILGIIFCASEQMDDMAAAINPDYIRRYSALETLCRQFKI